jgi:Flp pilus assembly pilin Flp
MRTLTSRFASLTSRLASGEQGRTALEYAFVTILTAFAIVSGATAVGTDLSGIVQNIAK